MLKQSIPTSLFGRRLRQARKRIGIAQDKLGVLIGMDENCSSARISRYETGIHEPPIATIEEIAMALGGCPRIGTVARESHFESDFLVI